MKQFLFLAFPLTVIVSHAQTDTTEGRREAKRLNGIDKTLNQVLADNNAAGFAVAVVKGNKVIYSKGFGYRDVAAKTPVTPNTLFAIGSTTKAFTAALMGILQDEGKLKLDDKATTHLPSLRFYDEAMNNNITIRDMMCHRTGLPRYDFSWYYFPTSSRDSMLARLAFQKPTYGLREKWQYNNYMFMAQGMIAERLTGKSWENNIADYFFNPLGMTHSTTSLDVMKKDPDHALPYNVDHNNQIRLTNYHEVGAMGPAGSIYSSVNDMSNWMKVWINGGQFGAKSILPNTYVKDAMSSQMIIGSGLPSQIHPDLQFSVYGFGWMLASYRGHYRVEHGGNIDGFTANVCLFPSDSIGIVVLANQENSDLTRIVRNIIADKLLELSPVDWNSELLAAQKNARNEPSMTTISENRIPDTKPSHELIAYEGDFFNPAYSFINVQKQGDSLVAQMGPHRLGLRHFHYDVFKAYSIGGKAPGTDMGMKLTFQTSADGKIKSLSTQFDDTGETIFDYTQRTVKLAEDQLSNYVGEYDLMGTAISVTIKDNKLFVLIPGQTNYETTAVGNHTFTLVLDPAFSIRFDVATDGKVTALNFVQPNGTFTATRKA